MQIFQEEQSFEVYNLKVHLDLERINISKTSLNLKMLNEIYVTSYVILNFGIQSDWLIKTANTELKVHILVVFI